MKIYKSKGFTISFTCLKLCRVKQIEDHFTKILLLFRIYLSMRSNHWVFFFFFSNTIGWCDSNKKPLLISIECAYSQCHFTRVSFRVFKYWIIRIASGLHVKMSIAQNAIFYHTLNHIHCHTFKDPMQTVYNFYKQIQQIT